MLLRKLVFGVLIIGCMQGMSAVADGDAGVSCERLTAEQHLEAVYANALLMKQSANVIFGLINSGRLLSTVLDVKKSCKIMPTDGGEFSDISLAASPVSLATDIKQEPPLINAKNLIILSQSTGLFEAVLRASLSRDPDFTDALIRGAFFLSCGMHRGVDEDTPNLQASQMAAGAVAGFVFSLIDYLQLLGVNRLTKLCIANNNAYVLRALLRSVFAVMTYILDAAVLKFADGKVPGFVLGADDRYKISQAMYLALGSHVVAESIGAAIRLALDSDAGAQANQQDS